ncbi:MAG TPA: hypothetical protein VGB45_05485 [Abditibacterium sp.]
MIAKLEISITREDIDAAGPGIICNPFASALSRTTGARWRVWNGRVAQEMVAPYRAVTLPENVQTAWESYADFSKLPPFTFQVDCVGAEWEEDVKHAA